jgi:hypothetical protein
MRGWFGAVGGVHWARASGRLDSEVVSLTKERA